MEKGIKLSCKRCGHKWIYLGKKKPKKYPQYVNCPICRSNVKLKREK